MSAPVSPPPAKWVIVHTGHTQRGDQVLAPSTTGCGRRWHRCNCVGLPIANHGGLIYRRRVPVSPCPLEPVRRFFRWLFSMSA